LVIRHSRDPRALVLRRSLRRDPSADLGAWAGKLGSHSAHHRFGEFGRLPHVQLNVWRVGIKGSGVALRVPVVPLRGALRLVTALVSG
jgi:hypothetical protein